MLQDPASDGSLSEAVPQLGVSVTPLECEAVLIVLLNTVLLTTVLTMSCSAARHNGQVVIT